MARTVYTLDVIASRVAFLSRPRAATTTPEHITDNDGAGDETGEF